MIPLKKCRSRLSNLHKETIDPLPTLRSQISRPHLGWVGNYDRLKLRRREPPKALSPQFKIDNKCIGCRNGYFGRVYIAVRQVSSDRLSFSSLSLHLSQNKNPTRTRIRMIRIAKIAKMTEDPLILRILSGIFINVSMQSHPSTRNEMQRLCFS